MYDLRGKHSGDLTALSPTDQRQGNKILWDCVCVCGQHRLGRSDKFVRGLITGCLDCDPLGRSRTRLGLSATAEYQVWREVRSGYPDFQEFLLALGLRPEGYKIGRLDPSKPHGNGNTAWVLIHPHVGERHGTLKVLSVFRTDDGKSWYRCICDCGRTVDRSIREKFGPGSHCGDISHLVTHGHCRGPKQSPTFVSWAHMLTRCNNRRSEKFRSYGAKGIKVCRLWHKSENFLADMRERPEE